MYRTRRRSQVDNNNDAKNNQREERERKEKAIKGKIKEGHQRGRENTSKKVIENELKVSVIKCHLLTLTPSPTRRASLMAPAHPIG